jgi:hypothetical protein
MSITILEENKDFIASESVKFITTNWPAYEVDDELCRRDAMQMVDIVAGELHLEGGIFMEHVAAPDLCDNFWQLNRYKKSFRMFRKQNDATIGTMQHIGELIKTCLDNKFNDQIDTIISLIIANSNAGATRTPHIEFIEEYFEKGFVVTKTPDHIHKMLWDEINNTNWIESKLGRYKKVPDWYEEFKREYVDPTGVNKPDEEKKEGYLTYRHAPQSLKDIAQALIDDKYFDSLKLYRPPTAVPKFLHFWNGAENSQHHVDSIDGSDLMIFCYATEEKDWKEEWGGYINCMKEVNNEFYHTKNVMPNDQTMVLVNNSAPIFKHGIRDLVNKNINRYTFIFHYTWTYDNYKWN